MATIQTITSTRQPPLLARLNSDQSHMEERRHLTRTLMGGTWHMRKAGERYLPREPRESLPAHNRRMGRTVLKNYYKKTLKSLTGRVFTKPMSVEFKSNDEDLKAFMEDVDLQGNNFNRFAQTLLQEGMHDGLGYVYVDMPKRPVDPVTGEPRRVSLSDMRNGKFRPYLVHVKAWRIIDWMAATGSGDPKLKQIRFREDIKVEDGEFSSKMVERIRVLDLVPTEQGMRQRFRVYERQENNSPLMFRNQDDPTAGYALVDEGVTTSPEIAFFTFYADRQDFMVGFPLLEDLAYMNLMHWQSLSDQRNILHVARVPILFGKGFEKDEDDKYEVDMEVGANIALYGPYESDMKYVEHQGTAINSGRQDLIDLEADMVTSGLEFLMARPSHESATARSIDQDQVNSPLKQVTEGLIDCLENALKVMALYVDKEGEDNEGEVKANGNLGLSMKDSASVANLIEMRKEGMISSRTFLLEAKKISALSDDIDVEAEVKEVEKEAADKQKREDEVAERTAANEAARQNQRNDAPGAPGDVRGPREAQPRRATPEAA